MIHVDLVRLKTKVHRVLTKLVLLLLTSKQQSNGMQNDINFVSSKIYFQIAS